ncbi:MAG: glycosyltransferase [Opitutales bacterium]
MRVLLANGRLGFRSGSEVHTRDLALALRKRGHDVAIFVGVLRDDDDVRTLRDAGVLVTDDLETLAATPDVIQGHQLPETTLACLRFPRAPALQVCHDATNARDAAGGNWMIQRRAAVDDYCRERVRRETGTPLEEIDVLFNPIDLASFARRGRPPATPPLSAALFHSSKETGAMMETVARACRRAGISLDVLGPGAGRFVTDPAASLPRYDLIFGKARCALEAMASGAHVILVGPHGLGPRPDKANFERLLRRNFGRSLLTEPLDENCIVRRIRELSQSDSGELTELVRSRCDSARLAEMMEGVYLRIKGVETHRRGFRAWAYGCWAGARLGWRRLRLARAGR